MYHLPTPPHDNVVDQKSLASPSVLSSRAGTAEGATTATTTTTTTTGGSLLASRSSSMEQRGTPADYSQSGLPSPFPSQYGDTRSEGSSADQQTAAAAAQFPTHSEVRSSNNYPAAAATAAPDYGVYPSSARSSSFPEHIQRTYPTATSGGGGGGAGMAHQTNSPSMPQQDGRNHHSHPLRSDSQLPIDPSIAAPSPTAYSYGPPHSPYTPGADMTQSYQYPQHRPEWTGYGHHSAGPMTPMGGVFTPAPSSAPPQPRQAQPYSFVTIGGATQQKRPRRRYEEIERMYKCGWNGCEKAYGTLNHLNAHVTMQSHGTKRTPEEFKEIRKEWKQRKKEEEAQRKAEEERQRQAAAAAAAQSGAPETSGTDGGPPPTTYSNPRPLPLPPIAFQPSAYAGPSSATLPQQSLQDYGGGQVYSYSPQSPYGGHSSNMYNQSTGNHPPSH